MVENIEIDAIELNRKLGGEYFIAVGKNSWKLFRCGFNNRLIMDSSNYTIEELYEFVKEHRKYDIGRVFLFTNMIFAFVAVILCIVNIFVHSTIIRAIIWTIDFIAVVNVIISEHYKSKNYKVIAKNLKDDTEYVLKEIKKAKEAETTKKVKSSTRKSRTKKGEETEEK